MKVSPLLELIFVRSILIGMFLVFPIFVIWGIWSIFTNEIGQNNKAQSRPSVVLCETAIKRQVQFPSTVDLNWLTDSQWLQHENGRQTLLSSFSTSNGFGVEKTYNVRCLYDQNGNLLEATIGK